MKCENCGRPLEQTNMNIRIQNEESMHFFCQECANTFGHCHMCEHSAHCEFHENPDSMPKTRIARKEQRTPFGISIMQTEIPNSERVKKFCTECKCFGGLEEETPYCGRYTGYATCTNYCEKTQFNFVQDFSEETQEKIENV